MKDRQLRVYLLCSFALAWPLQLLASWFAVQKGNAAAFTCILALTMFAPLAAALLAGMPTTVRMTKM